MKIGFIGAGTVAQTISKHVLSHGHEVILSNSRGPNTLIKNVKELGSGATAGTAQEAADQDIVVLASSWPSVQNALGAVPQWQGKILVDTTNRIASMNPFSLGDLSGPTSSEIIAGYAPGAKVVKAFNTVPMTWISDFSPSKPRTALFISGDDVVAKRKIYDLIEQIGLACIDLGSLAMGGRLQQLGGPLGGVRLNFIERFAP